jgi:hypothetical protein
MRKVSGKVVEKFNVHYMLNKGFWKNIVQPDDENIIRRLRFSCQINKAIIQILTHEV